MESFLIITIVTIIIVVFYVKSKKKKSMEVAKAMAAQRYMDVIDESIDFMNKSKKMETRISRAEVAIDCAEHLIDLYPTNSEYQEKLEELQNARRTLIHQDIQERAQKHLDKANLAKSLSSKINNANNALLILQDSLSIDVIDKNQIDKSIADVQLFIHRSEFDDYKIKAEQAEFKENYKKALGYYHDALFFLKKDDIEDTLQQSEIKEIESKIQELKNIIK